MKQLEPILKYHFWILLGIGLIVAFTGWWMTTGEMKAAIAARKSKIEEAVKKVPSGEVPSKDWEAKLKAINEQQERLVRQTRDSLYARQKEKMVWPAVVRESAAKLKYRGEFEKLVDHINYRDNYMTEVMRVYSIPRPITQSDPEGVIVFPLSAMPYRQWGDYTPTSKQMWDSMEDLWLLEPILQAVLEVNGGPSATRYDASILVIEEVKLRGGDRSKIGKSAQGGGGGGAMMGRGDEAMPAGMPRPGAAGLMAGMMEDDRAGAASFGGGGGGFGGGGGLDADDNIIFGDPGAGTEGGGGAAAGMPAGMPAGMTMGRMPDVDDDRSGGGAFTRQAGGEEVGRRYIDDDPQLPYRTRGFKLSVVMDHRKVPELYAQLTSSERSPWPIQIVQFHVGRLHESGGLQTGLAMGAGAAGMRGALGGFRGGGNLSLRGNPDEDEAPAMLAGRPFGGGAFNPGSYGGDSAGLGELMDNPLLARVILWGMITLYNEPEKRDEPASASPSTQPVSADSGVVSSEAGQEAADPDAEATTPEDEKGETGVDETTMSDEESRSEEEMDAAEGSDPSENETKTGSDAPQDNEPASSDGQDQ